MEDELLDESEVIRREEELGSLGDSCEVLEADLSLKQQVVA